VVNDVAAAGRLPPIFVTTAQYLNVNFVDSDCSEVGSGGKDFDNSARIV
jgi:hypothetical protein